MPLFKRRSPLNLRQNYFLYLYPDGRVDRRTFALGLVPLLIAGVVVHLVLSMDRPVWFFFDVFLVLFTLILAVKRCIDRGRSGWFLALGLAPVAWLIAVLDPKLVQELGGGTVIGPLLVGLEKPVQIVQLGATVSDLLNLAAFAAVDADR